MANQVLKRGPKIKPVSEKKIPVKIWVKAKYEKEAQQLINKVAQIFYDRDASGGKTA
jgi:succinyl-CoA synthetase beta subunit